MTIKDENTYNEIEERMEALLQRALNWAAWTFLAK